MKSCVTLLGRIGLAVLLVAVSQNLAARGQEEEAQATEAEVSETEESEETEASEADSSEAGEPESSSGDPSAAPAPALSIPNIASTEQGYHFPAALQVLAYNTYSQLAAAQGDANFCFSPQLLAKQLTALRFGANGQTALEVGDVFPFKATVPQTAEWLRQVDATSAQVSQGVQVPQRPPSFGQANAVWVPRDHPIVEPYINGVKTGLATELYAADFKNHRDTAATTVNAWVRDITNARLRSIMGKPDEDSLPDDVSVVTTGVVCASPRLAVPFNRQLSGTNKFQLASGEIIEVPMMRQIGSCMGLEMPNLQILVMPCVEENLWFVVFLPAAGQLGTLERSMTPNAMTQWFGRLQPMVVDVILPKLHLTGSLDLTETLDNLGLQTIATENADLTGMSQAVDHGPLKLSKFLHATQVTLVEQADIPQQQTPQATARFYVNRPFVFLLWNMQTETPLVIGRMTDPR